MDVRGWLPCASIHDSNRALRTRHHQQFQAEHHQGLRQGLVGAMAAVACAGCGVRWRARARTVACAL